RRSCSRRRSLSRGRNRSRRRRRGRFASRLIAHLRRPRLLLLFFATRPFRLLPSLLLGLLLLLGATALGLLAREGLLREALFLLVSLLLLLLLAERLLGGHPAIRLRRLGLGLRSRLHLRHGGRNRTGTRLVELGHRHELRSERGGESTRAASLAPRERA